MKLAYAIRGNAASIFQAQSDFQTSVVYVSSYLNGVLSSKLPLPSQNVPHWSEFVNTYRIANGDVLRWVNHVLAKLLSIPPDVQNYAVSIQALLEDCRTQAVSLVDNPAGQAAIRHLNENLKHLVRQMNLMISFYTGKLQAVQSFSEVLPNLARQLQTVASGAMKDSSCNRHQVASFIRQINQLQNDFDHRSSTIIRIGLGDTAPLTMGEVGVATDLSSTNRWLILGPVLAFSDTHIGLNSEKIRTAKETIEALQKEMDPLTADIAMMNVLSGIFTNLAIQCAQLEQNVEAALTAWQTLESELGFSIQDIQSALVDIPKSHLNFNALVKDLNIAVEEWARAANQVGSLAFDLKINDAELRCTMSEDQILDAEQSGKTFDIITYFNSVGALAKVA